MIYSRRLLETLLATLVPMFQRDLCRHKRWLGSEGERNEFEICHHHQKYGSIFQLTHLTILCYYSLLLSDITTFEEADSGVGGQLNLNPWTLRPY